MCQIRVMLLQDRSTGDTPIKNVRIKIGSVRPSYSAQLRIDADTREVGGVAQWREDSLEAEIGREINHALDAVLEAKMQAMLAESSCGNNVLQHNLLERRIGLSCASALASFQSSINSARCSAAHSVTKPSGAGRKVPSQKSQRSDRNERPLAGIAHVEVRRLVIAGSTSAQ